MEIDGIRFLAVPRLGRLKDLADVRELIPALNLPFELADRLDPFVRNKYVELWKGVSDRSRG